MKILVLGSKGQLGTALMEIAQGPKFPIGWEFIGWAREDVDITQLDVLCEKVKTLKPSVVINAAAYTYVDKAEAEAKLCQTINVKAPEALAKTCLELKIPLIHFSTDYVYAGEGSEAHVETDPHYPLNFYGMTKARGDEAIQKVGCDHLIFRTSWVYSHAGKNFVLTMLRLATEKKELRIVNDQVGSPTYAPDLAKYALEALMKAMELRLDGKPFPSGIYHLSNSDTTTWYDFAKAFLPKEIDIQGISTLEYPTPAKRPLNSRLSLEKFEKTFGIHPRNWHEALNECVKKIGASHG